MFLYQKKSSADVITFHWRHQNFQNLLFIVPSKLWLFQITNVSWSLKMNFLKTYLSCNITSHDVIIIVWKWNSHETTINITLETAWNFQPEPYQLLRSWYFNFQFFRSQYWNIVDIIIIFSSNKNKNCAFIWNLCENSNRMMYNIKQFTFIQKI